MPISRASTLAPDNQIERLGERNSSDKELSDFESLLIAPVLQKDVTPPSSRKDNDAETRTASENRVSEPSQPEPRSAPFDRPERLSRTKRSQTDGTENGAEPKTQVSAEAQADQSPATTNLPENGAKIDPQTPSPIGPEARVLSDGKARGSDPRTDVRAAAQAISADVTVVGIDGPSTEASAKASFDEAVNAFTIERTKTENSFLQNTVSGSAPRGFGASFSDISRSLKGRNEDEIPRSDEPAATDQLAELFDLEPAATSGTDPDLSAAAAPAEIAETGGESGGSAAGSEPFGSGTGIVSADGGGTAGQSFHVDKPASQVTIEPSRLLDQIEQPLRKLAAATTVEKDMRSLKIMLNPHDLGSVEITLVRHEGGSLSAHFITESEASRHALAENVAQLRESLAAAGAQLNELEISCRSNSSAGQGESEGRGSSSTAASRHRSAADTNSGGISEVSGESDIRLLNLRA